MRFGIFGHYFIVILSLILLVAFLTMLLYYYNPILDLVFADHKKLQDDTNLINFFEKTFGLAVTILVSSVALLSVNILKQQNELIKQQNDLTSKQHNLESRFRVKDYFNENFNGTIEVYDTVNSLFSAVSNIQGLQFKFGVNNKNALSDKAEYSTLIKPIYDGLIRDADRLMLLVRIRAQDDDFEQILDFCSSNIIKNFSRFVELRNRSTNRSKVTLNRASLYSCLLEFWKFDLSYPEPEIFEDVDVGNYDNMSYTTYSQDNLAVEIASANYQDIIQAIYELDYILHEGKLKNTNDSGQYTGTFKIIPQIILAALVLYNPDRIIKSLDGQEISDKFYFKLLTEIMESRLPHHQYIFKITNIYISSFCWRYIEIYK